MESSLTQLVLAHSEQCPFSVDMWCWSPVPAKRPADILPSLPALAAAQVAKLGNSSVPGVRRLDCSPCLYDSRDLELVWDLKVSGTAVTRVCSRQAHLRPTFLLPCIFSLFPSSSLFLLLFRFLTELYQGHTKY